MIYIYLINQARGLYWENILVRSQASLVNKRFIIRLKKALKFKGTQVRDHSGQCLVQYLENIGPAIEHFDWLILVIGPLTA